MKPRQLEPARKRRRDLQVHELELWRQVVRHVVPLPGRQLPVEPEEASKVPTSADPAPSPPPPQSMGRQSMGRIVSPAPLAPLVPLERRVRQRLVRGNLDIDARIDLHGMRQATAHAQLVAFLHRSHQAGARVVIVITGKGGSRSASAEWNHDESGVLRRMAPHWLAAPDLRGIVLGYETAAPHHGGEGALYVRLRGRRTRENQREP